jgi:hypothetical protein
VGCALKGVVGFYIQWRVNGPLDRCAAGIPIVRVHPGV